MGGGGGGVACKPSWVTDDGGGRGEVCKPKMMNCRRRREAHPSNSAGMTSQMSVAPSVFERGTWRRDADADAAARSKHEILGSGAQEIYSVRNPRIKFGKRLRCA